MNTARSKSIESKEDEELRLPNLEADVKQLRQYLDPQYTNNGNKSGTFNVVSFSTAPVIKTIQKNDQKNLDQKSSKSLDVPSFKVAVLTPKPEQKERVLQEIKSMRDKLHNPKKKTERKEETKRTVKEEAILSDDVGIRSPFIQIFQYLGAEKISGKEEWDLSTFLNKLENNQLPDEISKSINLKELFAQLILGVYELH